MRGLDWPGLMRAGMGRARRGGLGLLPEAFWRLTPIELLIMQGEAQGRPTDRSGLAALMQDWPDHDAGKEE